MEQRLACTEFPISVFIESSFEIGATLAYFQLSGKILEEMEALNMRTLKEDQPLRLRMHAIEFALLSF